MIACVNFCINFKFILKKELSSRMVTNIESACDIFLLGILFKLIVSCREDTGTRKNSKADCISILCLLSDLELSFRSLKLNPSYFTRVVKQFKLDILFREVAMMINFLSIDSFMDFLESAKEIFDQPAGCVTNELMGPTMISKDSYLGIFLRKVFVNLDLLSILDIGDLLESLRELCNFISNYNSFAGEYPGQSNTETHSSNRILQHQSSDIPLFLPPESDSRMGDDYYHKYFDVRASRNSYGDQNIAILPTSITTTQNICYQEAMLALSTHWIRKGHYARAITGIQEAINSAHHRGDHASVAKSLLLLHVVHDRLPEHSQTGLEISSENTLLRCLRRSTSLGLTLLASQSALLLAKYLSTVTSTNRYSAAEATPNKCLDQDDESDVESGHTSDVARVWTVLQAVASRDCHLLGIAASPRDSQSAAASALKKTPAKTSTSASYLPLPAYFNLIAQAYLVSVDYWVLLGLPAVAESCCRRAVLHLGALIGLEEWVALCNKLAVLRCQLCGPDNIYAAHAPRACDAQTLANYHAALSIIDICRRVISHDVAASSPQLMRPLECAESFARALLFLRTGRQAQAIAEKRRFMELSDLSGRGEEDEGSRRSLKEGAEEMCYQFLIMQLRGALQSR